MTKDFHLPPLFITEGRVYAGWLGGFGGYPYCAVRVCVWGFWQRQAAIGYCGVLCQNILHDVAVNVSETETAAPVKIGQLLVIDSQQLQDRGLQIVNVDRARR